MSDDRASLLARILELEKALKPFAVAHEEVKNITRSFRQPNVPDHYKAFVATTNDGKTWPLFTFGDLHCAARLLASDPDKKDAAG